MAATQADVDQLDAILDRLDDYTRANPDDPALDAIADDLTAWYKRMFRPLPVDGPAGPPAPEAGQGGRP